MATVVEPMKTPRRVSFVQETSVVKGMSESQRRNATTGSQSARDAKEEDKRTKKIEGSGVQSARRASLFSQPSPVFYIGGTNGTSLVEAALSNMGWKRNKDKNDRNIKVRWTDTKFGIDYNAFREGEELVNHIPNCDLITNKLGLILSLRDYERGSLAVKSRAPDLSLFEFVPETFVLDNRKEREQFFEQFKDGDIYICKPTGWNQGKGIYLVRDCEDFKKELTDRDDKDQNRVQKPLRRIVQKYLRNPLLLEGRKFDIRAYMLIASTKPFLVLYNPGYIRLSIHPYSNESTDLKIHLTNQYVQKKDPLYKTVKNDTVWNMEKFYGYIFETYGEEKKLPENIGGIIDRQIQRIILHVFNSVKNKLTARIGFFELYGFDFMIDTNMTVWLIEVNTNPALDVNCTVLKELLPSLIEESLQISLECFEKAKRQRALLPLANMRKFSMLFNSGTDGQNVSGSPRPMQKNNVTSRNRSQSLPRVHDPNRLQQERGGAGHTGTQRRRTNDTYRTTDDVTKHEQHLPPLATSGIPHSRRHSKSIEMTDFLDSARFLVRYKSTLFDTTRYRFDTGIRQT